MSEITAYQKKLLIQLKNLYIEIQNEIDRECNYRNSTNFADILYEISPELEFTDTAIAIEEKLKELKEREY